MAYAINGKIFAHTQWKSAKFEVGVKAKSIVVLNEEQEVVAIGQNAKHMSTTASQKMRDKWMLFERFKMALYNGMMYIPFVHDGMHCVLIVYI